MANVKAFGTEYTQGLRLRPSHFQRSLDFFYGNQFTESPGWLQTPGTSDWVLGAYTADYQKYINTTFYSPSIRGDVISSGRVSGVLIDGDPDSDAEPRYYETTVNTGSLSYNMATGKSSGTVTSVWSNTRENGIQTSSFIADGASWNQETLFDARSGAAYHSALFAGSDVITGTALYDSIDGGPGNDSIQGNAGNDYLAGGAGDDTIYGDDGDDQLFGGSGFNRLTGGDGADRYYIQEQGSAGHWTRKKPARWFDVRTVKRKVNGKKRRVTEFFVDDTVDVIEDFSIAEDTLYARGSGAVYDAMPQGIMLWNTAENNVIAFLTGMTESQYLNEIQLMPW